MLRNRSTRALLAGVVCLGSTWALSACDNQNTVQGCADQIVHNVQADVNHYGACDGLTNRQIAQASDAALATLR